MLKFWSSISLLVQIALVVGAVILFAFFDPFGLLTPRKQTLVDTPISVRSIQEIGKLISAEYYGEVLTSLQEAMIDEISTTIADEAKEVAALQTQFQQAILDLYDRKGELKDPKFRKGKKIYDFFYKQYPSLTQHPYYQTFIEMVLDKDYANNSSKAKIRRGEKKLLKALYDEASVEKLNVSLDSLTIEPQLFEKERQKREDLLTADKKFRKKQIVLLGRGWVKAGIDFKEFNERNFRYDKDKRTIHILGLKPEVLIATINPWFIPQKQVKGFEIILITRKANNPKYIKIVKQESLDKLRQKAIQAGILDQAKTNAEEALKNLFSLLIPEGIDEVIIHESFESYFDQSFLSDSLSYVTMQSVDSLFIKEYTIDSAAVVGLRDSIQNRTVYFHKRGYPASRYSSRLGIAEDETLTPSERAWLKQEKENIESALLFLDDTTRAIDALKVLPNRLDSIWFMPEPAQIAVYQQQADVRHPKKFGFWQVISDHPEYLAQQKLKANHTKRAVYKYLFKQKLSAYHALADIIKDNLHQVVDSDTTYVVDPDNEASKIIEDTVNHHKIKLIASLDDQLLDIDAGVHDLIRKERQTITPAQMVKTNQLMKTDWSINQQSVTELRNKAKTEWKLAIDDSTLIPVTRFADWYHFIIDDTLQQEEVNIIYSSWSSLQSDSTLLHQPVQSMDENWVYQLKIDELDKAWYYPDQETINSYQAEAKKRDFGTWKLQKNKRRKLRKYYVEQQIYLHILQAKSQDFMSTSQGLLDRLRLLDLKGQYFDRTASGFRPGLPDSLKFLEGGVAR